MPHDHQERLIALAGIYQAVHGVLCIARDGTAAPEALEPCIHSLFQVDADDVTAVFGQPGALATGARAIVAQLTGTPERNLELTRYVVQVMKLERALAARPDLLAHIGAGIAAARPKLDHFGLLHPNLFAHFADVYSATLSHLKPRLVIRGDAQHLRNPDNQNRVRALLLAAVRAAVLWRQVGGTRWQIIFGSRQILAEAQSYLASA